MKRKFRKRIERLEQIVNPEPYFNPVIIYDPNKPIPPRPPNVPEGQVLIYMPDNGRDPNLYRKENGRLIPKYD